MTFSGTREFEKILTFESSTITQSNTYSNVTSKIPSLRIFYFFRLIQQHKRPAIISTAIFEISPQYFHRVSFTASFPWHLNYLHFLGHASCYVQRWSRARTLSPVLWATFCINTRFFWRLLWSKCRRPYKMFFWSKKWPPAPKKRKEIEQVLFWGTSRHYHVYFKASPLTA